MSIEPLQKALVDADAETRRRAVLQLSIMPKDPALPELLMSALGDSDWRVRKEAAQVALRRAHELGLMEPLVRALCQGDNVGLRNAALDVLEELGEQAAPALIAALPNAPEQARKFVIEALGEAGGPLVIYELKQAAWSEDVNLAGEAIEALARIGGAEAESVIRSRLHAGDPFLRLAALEALNRLEANIAWEELQPLLDDRILRRVAVAALGRTGRAEALDPLFAALEDPALHTVGSAAAALAKFTRPYNPLRERTLQRLQKLNLRARTSLAALLGGAGEVELRRAAAELLAYAKDTTALGQIIVQLTLDAAAPEQLDALRYWGEEAVQPLVLLSATLEAPEERAVALELAADLVAVSPIHTAPLGRLVRDSLRPALHDHDPVVVAAAARSLAPYVEASDAETLVQCALSADPEVARSAARSLEVLVETERDAVERALHKVEVEVTQAAALASVLALLGGPEALERLRTLLSANEPNTRRAALQALGRIGGTRAAATVALALADENSEVQVTAAYVLGRLRDEQGGVPGATELLQAVHSEHAQVRASVARALGHTGLQRAVEPLTELLRDPDSGVAIAAVEALGQLAGAQLGTRLRAALVHPDREVVKAALRALTSISDPSAPEQLINALNHQAWDVRQLAAELIGERSIERARPALAAQLARESDDLARGALLEALRALSEEVR
ncbi:MAG TPA: HEAT repeat domain-containing protein [Polyangiales bacterium]|nr:HEAT repeat domain-containing protein [Polyangiales bacterium]